MIEVDEGNLLQNIDQAIDWIENHRDGGLISYVTTVKPIDLLTVFSNGKILDADHRVFWSDYDGLTMTGIGAAKELIVNGSDRYRKTQEWQHAVSKKAMKNLDVEGTGPIMLGGFSFSHGSTHPPEWNHFPESGFVIPRYLFTENAGKTWLTINVDLAEEENLSELNECLKRDLLQLTDVSHTSNQQTVKINQLTPEGKEEWLHAVGNLIQRIQSGEVEKVVMSRVLNAQLNMPLQPELLLGKMLEKRSYGFVFAVERGGECFLGATPERLIRRSGNVVLCDCLAGTGARGNTPEEDEEIGRALLSDEKNLKEHQFVVDMIKKSMTGIAHNIVSDEHPGVVKAESVQHLYTPVSGLMNKDVSIIDAVNVLHPTPAMGGTPRDKALSIIEELEPHDRGWYAAPVGWIDDDGNGDFAVGIRSCLVRGSQVRLFAGCGIVKDSIPEMEYQETEMKFRPILNALEALNNE
ncbi:MAG: isochorismate synthase [Tuberibacillus sp.]